MSNKENIMKLIIKFCVWERIELHPGSVSVKLHSRVSGRPSVESTLTAESAKWKVEEDIKVRASNSTTAIFLFQNHGSTSMVPIAGTN